MAVFDIVVMNNYDLGAGYQILGRVLAEQVRILGNDIVKFQRKRQS